MDAETGSLVGQVTGKAKASGQLAIGDRIIAVNGIPVKNGAVDDEAGVRCRGQVERRRRVSGAHTLREAIEAKRGEVLAPQRCGVRYWCGHGRGVGGRHVAAVVALILPRPDNGQTTTAWQLYHAHAHHPHPRPHLCTHASARVQPR